MRPKRVNATVTRCGDICLPPMMSNTAVRMSAMPTARRVVNDSPKQKQPMATAVIGSSAPRIAVGVEPISLTAIAISTNESTVGISASCAAYSHWCGVVSSCTVSPMAKV